MTANEQKESKLLAQEKSVVVPGEVLAEGMEYLPSHGTYRKNDRIYANQTGLLVVEGKVLKTIPLAGVYLPKRGDVIIGKVIDILMTGWRLDTNSPYSAVLPLKDATFDYIKKGADLTSYFGLDEYVMCKIFQVTSQNLIDVSMKGPGLRKLKDGRIVKVNAQKVPRIIGKRGSMVSMIKQATGCTVSVGQNGLVWLKGEPAQEILAVETIQKIEREAHVPGLTERIKTFLQERTGKEIDSNLVDEPEENRNYEERPRRDYSGERSDRGDRYGGDRRGPPRRDYGGDRYGSDRRGPPRRDFSHDDRGPRREFREFPRPGPEGENGGGNGNDGQENGGESRQSPAPRDDNEQEE